MGCCSLPCLALGLWGFWGAALGARPARQDAAQGTDALGIARLALAPCAWRKVLKNLLGQFVVVEILWIPIRGYEKFGNAENFRIDNMLRVPTGGYECV